MWDLDLRYTPKSMAKADFSGLTSKNALKKIIINTTFIRNQRTFPHFFNVFVLTLGNLTRRYWSKMGTQTKPGRHFRLKLKSVMTSHKPVRANLKVKSRNSLDGSISICFTFRTMFYSEATIFWKTRYIPPTSSIPNSNLILENIVIITIFFN